MGVNVKKIGLAALAGVSLQLGQMIAPAAADDALPSYGEAVWEQVARAIASPTKTNVDAAADRLVRLASEQPARYRAIDGRVLLISLADAHREQGRLAEALNVIIRVYTFDRAAYPNGVSLNEMLEVIDTMSDLLVENRRFAEALQYRFNAYEFDRDARRGTEPGTAVKSAALRGAAYLRFEKSIDDRPDLTAAERRAVEAFKRDYITPQVRRELGVGVADDAPDAKNADEAQRSVGFLSTHKLVRIFYGTNRRVASRHDANNPYGAEVGPLELGVVSINVPKSVLDDPTRIAPPNSLVFTVRGSGVEGLIVENIASYTENAFVSTLKSEMRASKRKELIVFVHGYNTSFRAAVERAATMKIGLDNVGNGSVALYSWPSGGSLYDYSEDRALISNNTVLGGLQRYLLLLMRESGAERVHLIAHSMGNEFLLEALSRMKASGSVTGRPFDEIVLASPDVSRQDFLAKAENVRSMADRITLYASRGDRALLASRYLNAAKSLLGGAGGSFFTALASQRRAGDAAPPILVSRDGDFQTIDTTAREVTVELGHEDFVGPAVNDLRSVIWFADTPKERCILRERRQNSTRYWALDSGRCDEDGFELASFYLRREGPDRAKRTLLEDAKLAPIDKRAAFRDAARIIDNIGD